MKIELRAISEIHPYENNPRINDKAVDAVAASLKEFGFRQPIVVDKDGIIIVGHTRYKAAQKLGLEKVPVHAAKDLTDAQIKAYRIADNQTATIADWNYELLPIELKDLQGMEFNLDLLGFDADELAKLLGQEVKEGLTDPDDVPTPPDEAITKPGDIWILGDHRLMCGDSTKTEDVALLMNGQLADMVFTDPPWNVNYGAVEKGNAQGYKPRTILNDYMGTDDFREFMESAFARMNEASAAGAMTYVVMSAQEWGNMMLAMAINNYHWSSTIIWNKDRLVLSRKDYHTKYEPLWYGWKDGEARVCPLDDRKQSDVWDIPRPSSSELHPTTKPVELVERALLNSSRLGNTVLDLFLGSGSTLIACERTGRKCYSMELDPIYCDVIRDRWEKFTGQKAQQAEGQPQ